MDLKGIDEKYRKQLKSKKYVASPSDGDCTYEVVTTTDVIDNDDSLEQSMRKFLSSYTSSPSDVECPDDAVVGPSRPL